MAALITVHRDGSDLTSYKFLLKKQIVNSHRRFLLEPFASHSGVDRFKNIVTDMDGSERSD